MRKLLAITCLMLAGAVYAAKLPIWTAGGAQLNLASGAAAPLWTPSNTTTIAWWDASDTSKILTTGSAVTNWLDKSGNGNTMIDSGASTRPASGTTNLNSKNVIAFDGGDFLNKNPVDFFSTNVMFMMVAGIGTVNNAADSIFSVNSAGAEFQIDAESNDVFRARVNVNAMGAGVDLTTSATYEGPSIYAAVFDWGSSIYNLVIDGTARTGNGTYTTALVTPTQVFCFRNNGAQQCPSGICAEFIITTNVSTAVRQRFEGYLAWKWGLNGSLPAGHPYKNAAPTQ